MSKIILVGAGTAFQIFRPSYPSENFITMDTDESLHPTVMGNCNIRADVARVRSLCPQEELIAIIFERVSSCQKGEAEYFREFFPNTPILILGFKLQYLFVTLAYYREKALLIGSNPRLLLLCPTVHSRQLQFDSSYLIALRDQYPVLDRYLLRQQLDSSKLVSVMDCSSYDDFSNLTKRLFNPYTHANNNPAIEDFLGQYRLDEVAFDKTVNGKYCLKVSSSTSYRWLKKEVETYQPGFFRKNFSTGGATKEIRRVRLILTGKSNSCELISDEDKQLICRLYRQTLAGETGKVFKSLILHLQLLPRLRDILGANNQTELRSFEVKNSEAELRSSHAI